MSRHVAKKRVFEGQIAPTRSEKRTFPRMRKVHTLAGLHVGEAGWARLAVVVGWLVDRLVGCWVLGLDSS